MTFQGACLCGAVRYQAHGTPLIQFNCHCRDCQRSTGAAFAPILFFRREDVQLHGELAHFESPGGSGAVLRRGFCRQCGAQMTGEPASAPGLISLRAGTLDDPAMFQPSADIFVAQAAPWDCLSPLTSKHDGMLPRRGT